MDASSIPKYFRVRLGYSLLGVLLCSSVFGFGQTASFSFDKEGHFFPVPSQPLYEGNQPFDILHYRLDVNLAMADDGFQGRAAISMRLKASIDSLVLNSVGLSLDTVTVDGVAKSVTMDPAMEAFVIHLGQTRSAGDTLQIEIS